MMGDSDNLNVLRESGRDDDSGRGPGLTRRVEGNKRIGRQSYKQGRPNMFAYDRVQGAANAQLMPGTDLNDRMSDEQALATMRRIHEAYGVQDQLEGFLYDFDNAMFISYAMNGGSQVAPHERVKFKVIRDGQLHTYEYNTLFKVLGIDMRRFFRAYANEVIDACRQLYYGSDITIPSLDQLRSQMESLAAKRNLSRMPYLIADCADACSDLSPVELSMVMASKQAVVGKSTNAVDQMRGALPIHSSDNYDSTLNKVVPVATEGSNQPFRQYYP